MSRYIYNTTTQKFEKLPQYIYQTSDNRLEIRKKINGKLEYWGRYTNLKTAIYELQLYIDCNWDINLIIENT